MKRGFDLFAFENGRAPDWNTRQADKAYRAQIAYNARVRRILESADPYPVPPPPDYSTPAKVSARARERGTSGATWAGSPDPKFTRLYREFRALVPDVLKCSPFDLHTSRYRIVYDPRGAGYTLAEIPAPAPVQAPARRRRSA